MKKINVKITYVEELLGTASADPELHSTFIASKAPDAKSREEEIADLGVSEVTEKAMTVFPRLSHEEKVARDIDPNEDVPFTYDYQWKGYFKESCGMLRRATGYKSAKLRAYKKEIDGLLFITPRKLPLIMPEGAKVGELQRPLRASTPQGERVALAHSETVPAGTRQEFTITLLKDDLVEYVHEWLDYGQLHGTGQWRNAGFGTFTHSAYGSNGEILWVSE